ncbi:hypothetical protein [Xenorhabdus vietnamensis]|uniref:hypothetical protein n=1 Tax=Xenorhabdus vietnamensis TaxID=351656 RepID=UPI001ABF8C80|nr:hypothetical protein [Xenorhabdus vietnamensis]
MAAEIALFAIHSSLSGNQNILQVNLVCFDDENYDIYRSLNQQMLPVREYYHFYNHDPNLAEKLILLALINLLGIVSNTPLSYCANHGVK